jgi:hypothetical protein
MQTHIRTYMKTYQAEVTKLRSDLERQGQTLRNVEKREEDKMFELREIKNTLHVLESENADLKVCLRLYLCICMYTCIYVNVNVCVCVYIYIYIYEDV